MNYVKNKYNLNVIKQYTTRKRRNNLDDEYIFVNKEEFLDKDIIFKKRYSGNLYGVSYQCLRENDTDAILITDLLTAIKIKKELPAQIIYVRTPLYRRIKFLKNGVRNKARILIDILYTFDFIFADKIINNNKEKVELFYEVQRYFGELHKNS